MRFRNMIPSISTSMPPMGVPHEALCISQPMGRTEGSGLGQGTIDQPGFQTDIRSSSSSLSAKKTWSDRGTECFIQNIKWLGSQENHCKFYNLTQAFEYINQNQFSDKTADDL